MLRREDGRRTVEGRRWPSGSFFLLPLSLALSVLRRLPASDASVLGLLLSPFIAAQLAVSWFEAESACRSTVAEPRVLDASRVGLGERQSLCGQGDVAVGSRDGELCRPHSNAVIQGVVFMATQWYLIQGDDNFGPMTSDELKKLAADGKIGRRDLVRKEGTTRWFPTSAIEGLLSTPITTPSAPSVKTSSPGSYSPVEPPPPADVKRTQPEPKPEPEPGKQPRRAPTGSSSLHLQPTSNARNLNPSPNLNPAQTASPGERSWSGSRWVRLGAQSTLLTVVIASAAMWIVMPNSSRVQEVADHPPADPPIATAAPLARPVPGGRGAPTTRPSRPGDQSGGAGCARSSGKAEAAPDAAAGASADAGAVRRSSAPARIVH